VRTRVKICGITNSEDAAKVIDAGADAIGLVFYRKSPRYIELQCAQEIIRSLPALVTVVGLFVNESAAQIETILNTLSLDQLQFHGDESNSDCIQFGKPYFKAVKVQDKDSVLRAQKLYPDANALLLDTPSKDAAGGTGKTFDWGLVPTETTTALILAGGLHSDNVTQAIVEVGPYAVDVSSGVESAPGIKDREKIFNFITRVRDADASRIQ